jgi:hypothetical protein
MTTSNQLREAINHYLKEKLQKANCLQGHLTGEYRNDAPTLFTLSGTREDGRPIILWELDQSFKNNVDAFFQQVTAISFSITLNLLTDEFVYKSSALPPKREAVKPAVKELSDTLYGHELAQAVADALEQDSIGYSHRDYCGTGMEKKGSVYLFGPIWDGGLEPTHSFADTPSFVQWLATQSDKSLAGEGPYNPQDICRKRLEDWLAGRDS